MSTLWRNIQERCENKYTITNVPIVVNYSARNHNIPHSAKQYFPILYQSLNLQWVIKKSEIINSWKQLSNIKKLLTKPRHPFEKRQYK